MTRLAPMRKYLTMTISLVAGLACALALAACGGGGGTLSGDTAQQLLNVLDDMQAQADQGNCSSVASNATDIAAQVAQRESIDPKLRAALVQGFQHLAELASEPGGCESTVSTETTTTETQTTDTQTTESTPTQTTDTTPDTVTTPTQTTPTQTTPTNPTGGTGGGSGGISP